MNNPMFTDLGIPIRFQKPLVGHPAECNCIIGEVEKRLAEMDSSTVSRVSHIWVCPDDWNNHRVRITRFSLNQNPADVDMGTFEFSDRRTRPLFIKKVS